ncbi:MAG: DUF1836 domain-containing protein [Oscillospiraceae bacterium]|nr:DUF1836 domain-containing protein [Oscillospiraceae bacterium]
MTSRQELCELLKTAFNSECVKPSDFPQLDLYIDQILTVFDTALGCEESKEKPLTKSMINNYSKEKLLTPIKGKTYPRQQILELLAIFQLKNTLPMSDIKLVLDSIRIDENCPELLTQLLEQTAEITVDNHGLSDISSEPDRKECLKLLLEMSRKAYLYRKACEALVDQCFEQNK